MNRDEFEERTGFFPSQSLYGIIEKHYAVFPGDKDEFCKAYKENEDGLAWKVQEEADSADFKAAEELKRRDIKIAGLEEELERRQDWKPYESPSNVSQADYGRLARGAGDGISNIEISNEPTEMGTAMIAENPVEAVMSMSDSAVIEDASPVDWYEVIKVILLAVIFLVVVPKPQFKRKDK